MKKIEIVVKERPRVSNPILICGLPDSGYVARLAAQKIVEITDAKLVAEIYSAYFPPSTIIEKDGTTRLMRNELYHSRLDHKNLDLMIYTGDIQPEDAPGAYELAEQVLETAKSFGVREAIILAAFIRGHEVTQPKVYGTATDAPTAEEYKKRGVVISNEGYITWMHGLLLGLSTLKGIRAICLSSETRGDRIDPPAAMALLKVLGEVLQVDFKSEHAEPETAKPGTTEFEKPPRPDESEKTRYIR